MVRKSVFTKSGKVALGAVKTAYEAVEKAREGRPAEEKSLYHFSNPTVRYTNSVPADFAIDDSRKMGCGLWEVWKNYSTYPSSYYELGMTNNPYSTHVVESIRDGIKMTDAEREAKVASAASMAIREFDSPLVRDVITKNTAIRFDTTLASVLMGDYPTNTDKEDALSKAIGGVFATSWFAPHWFTNTIYGEPMVSLTAAHLSPLTRLRVGQDKSVDCVVDKTVKHLAVMESLTTHTTQGTVGNPIHVQGEFHHSVNMLLMNTLNLFDDIGAVVSPREATHTDFTPAEGFILSSNNHWDSSCNGALVGTPMGHFRPALAGSSVLPSRAKTEISPVNGTYLMLDYSDRTNHLKTDVGAELMAIIPTVNPNGPPKSVWGADQRDNSLFCETRFASHDFLQTEDKVVRLRDGDYESYYDNEEFQAISVPADKVSGFLDVLWASTNGMRDRVSFDGSRYAVHYLSPLLVDEDDTRYDHLHPITIDTYKLMMTGMGVVNRYPKSEFTRKVKLLWVLVEHTLDNWITGESNDIYGMSCLRTVYVMDTKKVVDLYDNPRTRLKIVRFTPKYRVLNETMSENEIVPCGSMRSYKYAKSHILSKKLYGSSVPDDVNRVLQDRHDTLAQGFYEALREVEVE